MANNKNQQQKAADKRMMARIHRGEFHPKKKAETHL